MKITYINEAIKLPSMQQKKVTAKDIRNVNLNYVKSYITKYVKDSFSSNFTTIYDLTPKNTLVPWVETLDPHDSYDFSPAIAEINDSGEYGEYVVTLRLYLSTFSQNFSCNEIECIDIKSPHIKFYNMLQQVAANCEYPIKFKLMYYSVSFDDLRDIANHYRTEDISVFEDVLQKYSPKVLPKINRLKLYRYVAYGIQHEEYLKDWAEYVKMIVNPFSENLQVDIPLYGHTDGVPEYLLTAHNACVNANVKCNNIYVFDEDNEYIDLDIYTWMQYVQQITDIAIDRDEFCVSLPGEVFKDYVADVIWLRKSNSTSEIINIYLNILRVLNIRTVSTSARISYYPVKSKFYAAVKSSFNSNVMQFDLTAMAEHIIQKYGNCTDNYVINADNKSILLKYVCDALEDLGVKLK